MRLPSAVLVPSLVLSLAAGTSSCREAHAQADESRPKTAAVRKKSEAATDERTAKGPSEQAPPLQNIEVLLCDGETKTVVPPGTSPSTIAGQLMTQWLRKNPGRDWEQGVRERHGLVPAFDNSILAGPDQGQTHGRVTKLDAALWKEEVERFALAGSRVFHSGDELGSTIGVSCDMCHPNAANTHPETYPKFQPQLGRVALLRDMINWCIEHPVRGQVLASDDPRMRALEGYINAQRTGTPMAYGKH